MEAPINVAELKLMLKSMNHRERFVFQCKNHKTVEVYKTFLYDTTNEANICLTIIYSDGQTKKQNKLLKLFSDKIYKQLLEIISN
jgi:hypothetical protein